jgi:hypothetical protein
VGLTRAEERAAWYLAGLFDGEGWIRLQHGTSGCAILIANTDPSIIHAAVIALDMLGIAHTLQDRRLSEANENHKDLVVIAISQRAMCERFIRVVPFLSEDKREKATRLSAGRRKLKGHERPVERMIELRDAGYSKRAAAKEMGIGYATIKRWVMGANIKWA